LVLTRDLARKDASAMAEGPCCKTFAVMTARPLSFVGLRIRAEEIFSELVLFVFLRAAFRDLGTDANAKGAGAVRAGLYILASFANQIPDAAFRPFNVSRFLERDEYSEDLALRHVEKRFQWPNGLAVAL
jgi:hypothetical protein